jgi:hypothetical protein
VVDDVDSQTKPWLTSSKTCSSLRASEHALLQCSSSLKKPRLTLERRRKSLGEKPIQLWQLLSRKWSMTLYTDFETTEINWNPKKWSLIGKSRWKRKWVLLEVVVFGSNLSNWPCLQEISGRTYTMWKTWASLITFSMVSQHFFGIFSWKLEHPHQENIGKEQTLGDSWKG